MPKVKVVACREFGGKERRGRALRWQREREMGGDKVSKKGRVLDWG